MSQSHQTIFDLPRNERIELVMQLWDSIAREKQPIEISEGERQMLDKTLANSDSGRTTFKPWEEVKKQYKYFNK